MPEGPEGIEGTPQQITMWANKFLFCGKCEHLPFYNETAFRIGVIVEEELGENQHEEGREDGKSTGAVQVKRPFGNTGPIAV